MPVEFDHFAGFVGGVEGEGGGDAEAVGVGAFHLVGEGGEEGGLARGPEKAADVGAPKVAKPVSTFVVL